ncbi:MAG: class I SAM-dependent methyltransferase [Lacipirellulaceae bacterium]
MLEVARSIRGDRVLGVPLGRPDSLADLAAERPAATVVSWLRDSFRAAIPLAAATPTNLTVVCSADPPEGPFDLAVVPTSMRGDAELTRETLQESLHRLELGGVLVAATDNPRDAWLRQQMDALCEGVRLHRFDDAVVYAATKTRPMRKRRDFSCDVAFRDEGRLLRAVTRPGVFSHRHVDPGARRLMEAARVAAGDRVVDIGCGAGTVAIALAARKTDALVLAVDSDTRAVECTTRGASLNGLTNIEALLNASGDYPTPRTFDLAVTNPPYYADHQIAARMVCAAARSLREEGRLLVVTKAPGWYAENLDPELWRDVEITARARYHVVFALRT